MERLLGYLEYTMKYRNCEKHFYFFKMFRGFAGHPMRKDYVPENQNVLEERPR